MYIVKNALTNLKRNKGRNILLMLIIFTLILTTTVALAINTTTKEIINDYKDRFGSKVTLSVDFDKLMAETKPSEDGVFEFPTATEISPEQYLDFADSDFLKSYKIDMSSGIVFDKLKAIAEEKSNGIIGSIGSDKEYVSPKAKLIGFSDTKNMSDFTKGLRKIIDGNFYKEKNECLISSDFANLNKLNIGDTFEIMDITNKKKISLKVAGIYADATKENGDFPAGSMSLSGTYGNRRNEILVNLNTMQDNFDINSLSIQAEYELKSPDVVKNFEKELRTKGLPDEYNVETDEAGYNKIVAPVVGMSKISVTFMWVILIIGGIILLFVTSMAIRERKYEIGVLRTMGLKKAKIAFMLVTEMTIITLVCLGFGLVIGNTLSQPVADSLIKGQVEAIDKNQQNNNFQGSINVGNSDTSINEETLTEIDISLTKETVIQISLIAFLLALLSSVVGVVSITKYEPMKILSERN